MTDLSEVLQTLEKLEKTTSCVLEFSRKNKEARESQSEATLILPNPEKVRDFYSDYLTFKSATMKIDQGILILKTDINEIRINMIGILELLSSKLDIPIQIVPNQITNSKAPFVDDIDAVVNHWMEWIKVEFNRIMAVDDPRIRKMCLDYHRVQSYPLLVRLDYYKWEKQFTKYYIDQTEERISNKMSLELREIRTKYSDRLTKEKSALNLKISQLHNELKKVRVVNDRLNNFSQQNIEDNTALKQDIELLHDKMKGNQDIIQKQTEELSKIKSENDVMKHRLDRYESEEWKLDFASTNENSIFYNIKDNEIIKFPCSIDRFRINYSLESSDGTYRIYIGSEGKVFKVPETLARKIPSLIKSQSPDEGASKQNVIRANGKDVKVTEGVKLVFEYLTNSGKSASTREIMEGTGIAQSTIGTRHLKALKELGILEEEDRGGMKKYNIINTEE